MQKLSELKPKQSGIEIIGTIKQFDQPKKFLICYECNAKSMVDLEEYEGKCPQCRAQESPDYKKGVWAQDFRSALVTDESGDGHLDLWKNQVAMFKEGDSFHLTNGYAREDKHIMTGKFGQIKNVG